MNRRNFLAASSAAAALHAQPAAAKSQARLKPALCVYSFRKELQSKALTHEDLIHKCVEWNIDGLDLTVYWLPSTDPAWLASYRRLAFRNGINIYSIAIRTELTKPAQTDRDAEVANIKKWVDVASLLGAGHIRVFGGTVPKTATEEQAVPWVVECLQRGGEYAAQKAITLGLENHGGICTNATRIVEMVTKTNNPFVAINLDTGNFRTDAYNQMRACLPYAANVQVKSEMIHEDGKKGPQDWDKVLQVIAAGAYKGYLALEYEAAEPAPTAVPKGLASLSNLCRKHSA